MSKLWVSGTFAVGQQKHVIKELCEGSGREGHRGWRCVFVGFFFDHDWGVRLLRCEFCHPGASLDWPSNVCVVVFVATDSLCLTMTRGLSTHCLPISSHSRKQIRVLLSVSHLRCSCLPRLRLGLTRADTEATVCTSCPVTLSCLMVTLCFWQRRGDRETISSPPSSCEVCVHQSYLQGPQDEGPRYNATESGPGTRSTGSERDSTNPLSELVDCSPQVSQKRT